MTDLDLDPKTPNASATDGSGVLDEAFERLAASGFELPNGFVNHAPMACEALFALGLENEVGEWSRRFDSSEGRSVEPVLNSSMDADSLSDYSRLADWIGYFTVSVEDEGWAAVTAKWVPRLFPALAAALFHAAIRAGHAVRAVSELDTAPRRAELARALGYWAARWRPGEPAGEPPGVDEVRAEVVAAACDGALWYLREPNIYNLHGITGAMAVELLVGHVSPAAGAAALAQLRAEHAALHRGSGTEKHVEVSAQDQRSTVDRGGFLVGFGEMARAAAASHDPHQVKLVEACRRGFDLSGDSAFWEASETVTGLRLEGRVPI